MIASNPHPSGGDDRGGRTKHRPIGSNLISGSGGSGGSIITSGNGYLYISPAILLIIAMVAYGTPLANGAEPDYFKNLFEGATYRGWDCHALMSLSTDIDTCYAKAKSNNCTGMKTFWSCVYHKSCGRCGFPGAHELLQTMQANAKKTKCRLALPVCCGKKKAKTGKCLVKKIKKGSSNATEQHSPMVHEDFMKCFETLKKDLDVKKCQQDGNNRFNITYTSMASLNASCSAVDYSLHCINEASCKKCTYLGSWAVYYWYNKAIQRAGCEDLDRKEFKKECQTNLTSPPTFGPTEKETTEKPERKSTTQVSFSKTGLIIGMIVLVVLVLLLIVCAVGGYFYWAGQSETAAADEKNANSSGTGGKGGPAPKSTLARAAEGKSKVGSSMAGSQAPKSSLATKSNVGPTGFGVAGTKAPSAVKSELGPLERIKSDDSIKGTEPFSRYDWTDPMA